MNSLKEFVRALPACDHFFTLMNAASCGDVPSTILLRVD